jgi:hypothetical protein
VLQLAEMTLEETPERALVPGLRRRQQGLFIGGMVRDRVRHRFVTELNGGDTSISSVA